MAVCALPVAIAGRFWGESATLGIVVRSLFIGEMVMNISEKENERKKQAHETHARWQGIALTQLGYSVNLILAFSLASIGFGVSCLQRNNNANSEFLFGALCILVVSTGFGIFCTITRLCDFRKTREITKLKLDTCYSSKIARLQECATRLGKYTWCLFWWQTGTFFVGFILLAASIAIAIFQWYSLWVPVVGLALLIVVPMSCFFMPRITKWLSC